METSKHAVEQGRFFYLKDDKESSLLHIVFLMFTIHGATVGIADLGHHLHLAGGEKSLFSLLSMDLWKYWNRPRQREWDAGRLHSKEGCLINKKASLTAALHSSVWFKPSPCLRPPTWPRSDDGSTPTQLLPAPAVSVSRPQDTCPSSSPASVALCLLARGEGAHGGRMSSVGSRMELSKGDVENEMLSVTEDEWQFKGKSVFGRS